MIFAFGNTHEEIPIAKAKAARSAKNTKNTHRWAMFVLLNND